MELDKGLSKAGVCKLVKQALNPLLRKSATGVTPVMTELTELFIHEVMKRSLEACSQNNRKTIKAEHIFEGIASLGFKYNEEEVSSSIQEWSDKQLAKQKLKLKIQDSNMSHEELVEDEERLLAAAEIAVENSFQIVQDEDDYDN